MRRKRLVILISSLAILSYGFCGTGAWIAVKGLLPPRAGRIAGIDFPCEFHNCGCDTAQQCRINCCCFRGSAAVETGSCCDGPGNTREETGAPSLGSAPCRGGGGTIALVPAAQPGAHLSPRIGSLLLPRFAERAYRAGLTRFNDVAPPPPEKIPISSCHST